MFPGRTLAEWGQRLDTGGLKRLAAITYFGVYALLFVAHRPVAWIVSTSVDPVWMVVDLPQSLAMGVLSIGVTTVVVGIAAVRDASETMAEEQPSTGASTGASAGATATGTASRGASTAPATTTHAHGLRVDGSTTPADRPGTGSGTTTSAATERRAVDPAPTRQPTSQSATETQPSTATTATGTAGSDSGAETEESAADTAAGPGTDRPPETDQPDEPAADDADATATEAEAWPGEWIGGDQL